MNRLGAALTGEADPPISSLFVYNANPVASSPNAGKIVEGLLREDLFTVVHDLFETDTARYADLLLPATSQLEQMDLHKPYGGEPMVQLNLPAIAPQGEARSNWDVMRGLAKAMGFTDSWLQQDAESVIREVLEATARTNPYLKGISYERLQSEGFLPIELSKEERIPFAHGYFPTPSGKVEFYSAQAATKGYDPLPGWEPDYESSFTEIATGPGPARLPLISPAAHHFVSSTFGNQERMIAKEQAPTLHIHPQDALSYGVKQGQLVRVSNERGWCRLVADVTEDVRPGMLATTTVWWPKFSPDQRNINWTTSDRLADFNGGSTFYTNMVSLEPVEHDPEVSA
jgi:anaerobic selenocysteine-containing dehydrogenase